MVKGAELTYQQKGDKVVMTNNSPKDTFLTPKEVLTSIDGLRNRLDNYKQQREELKQKLQEFDDGEYWTSEQLKLLGKHESWALKQQTSKIKALIDEVKKKVKDEIDDPINGYKYDVILDDKENARQKFVLYQRGIATHPKVNEACSPTIIKKYLFIESVLDNPWK